MANVAIVTDTVSTIPEPIVESLGIRTVPYYVYRGTETLRDLVTIQTDEFYAWLRTARELPKTACPGPGEYLNAYESFAAQGAVEILSIHMTSKGSGAYQSALAAKASFAESRPDVRLEVIDTLNASMCHGWMVIEAARAAKAGRPLAEIVALIHRMIPKTRMIQTGDTLRYLYMGGRIGRAGHLVGSILNIKPLIGMEDGVIVSLGTTRSLDRAYQSMADLVEAGLGKKARIKIAYVHAAAPAEAEKIRALIEPRMTCVESIVAELSPALGVYSGPGTAGISYFPAQIVEPS